LLHLRCQGLDPYSCLHEKRARIEGHDAWGSQIPNARASTCKSTSQESLSPRIVLTRPTPSVLTLPKDLRFGWHRRTVPYVFSMRFSQEGPRQVDNLSVADSGFQINGKGTWHQLPTPRNLDLLVSTFPRIPPPTIGYIYSPPSTPARFFVN
jgi:hypothetical protein